MEKELFLKLINLFLAALGLRCCTWAFSSCGEWSSHCDGFSCCREQALGSWGSVVLARGLSSCGSRPLELRLSSCGARGLVAPQHVGSSRARTRTRVPCIGRWIPNHCTTRKVPRKNVLKRILGIHVICDIISLSSISKINITHPCCWSL